MSNTIESQTITIDAIVERSASSKEQAKNTTHSIHELANNANNMFHNIHEIAKDSDQVSANIREISHAILRSQEGIIQIKDISIGLSEMSKKLDKFTA